MGKTGLIQHCFHLLHQADPQIPTIYIDIYHTHNLAEFVNVFAGSVLGRFDSAPQKALERAARFFKKAADRL